MSSVRPPDPPAVRRRRRWIVAVVVGAVLAGSTPAAEAARNRLEWADLEATVRGPLDPASTNPCTRGDALCVAVVRRELKQRIDRWLERCDHRAAFGFVYLWTTTAVGVELERGQRFADEAYLTALDGVFAKLYFDAADDYDAIRDRELSAAWGIAFQAAADRAISGIGDLLLGMNAHISRDLPFVVAEMGTLGPGGLSRKPDFDAVNQVLQAIHEPILKRVARRLDPTIADFSIPGLGIDETTFAAVIAAWRDEAWRNGERLLAAPDPAARTLVAQQIEAIAQLRAQTIQAATRYLPFGPSTRERDRYCRARN